MAAKSTTKSKSAEHTLKVGYVKQRSRWEGECSCGEWDCFGGRTEADIVGNFEIHAKNRGALIAS